MQEVILDQRLIVLVCKVVQIVWVACICFCANILSFLQSKLLGILLKGFRNGNK